MLTSRSSTVLRCLRTTSVPAAAPLQHVRGVVIPASLVSGTDSTSDRSGASDAQSRKKPPVGRKTGDLEQQLKGLSFPKVNRRILQDDQFIAVAEEAVEIVRKIDNVRKEYPRYFEPSEFEKISGPGSARMKSPSRSGSAISFDEPEDVDEGEPFEREDPLEEEERISVQKGSEKEDTKEGQTLQAGEGPEAYINLEKKKAKKALPKHLDPRYIERNLAGHMKTQQEVLESLKDWYDEYKFISEGGRFSLAEQTRRHTEFMRDYEMRMESERTGDLESPYEIRSDFVVNEVLEVGRHTKVTKGGRIFSFSALVLVGTGKGTAGFGYGKGATAPEATRRAFVDAERNLISVPLYRGGLPGGFKVRKRGSFVHCWTHHPGPDRNFNDANLVPHPIMNNIIHAFGFNNASMRTWKRRNWHNMLEGIFTMLPKFASHPEDTARRMGLKLKVLAHDERFDKLKPHYL